jgi:hypothetical protein
LIRVSVAASPASRARVSRWRTCWIISAAEILGDFPDLTAEDIQACLTFAAERERRLTVAA